MLPSRCVPLISAMLVLGVTAARAEAPLVPCPADAVETDLTTEFSYAPSGLTCPPDRITPPGDACDDGSYLYDVFRTSIWGAQGDPEAGFPFAQARWPSFWLNINGNISFGGPVPTYTPQAIPGVERPMIAVYFGDVDLSSVIGNETNPGRVLLCEDPAHQRIMFTWQGVGYFNARYPADRLNSFQMILSNPGPVCDNPGLGTVGGLGVEFRYSELVWYVGEASGSNALGTCDPGSFVDEGGPCVPAVAGFDGGDSVVAYQVEGTRTALVNSNLLAGTGVGAVEPGLYRFELLDGAVLPSLCDDGISDPCIMCEDDLCDAPIFDQCSTPALGTVVRISLVNAVGQDCSMPCAIPPDADPICDTAGIVCQD